MRQSVRRGAVAVSFLLAVLAVLGLWLMALPPETRGRVLPAFASRWIDGTRPDGRPRAGPEPDRSAAARDRASPDAARQDAPGREANARPPGLGGAGAPGTLQAGKAAPEPGKSADKSAGAPAAPGPGDPGGQHQAGRTEPPAGRTEPPAGRTEPPAGRPEPPAGRADSPAGRAQPPAGRADGQAGRTEPSAGRAEPPAGQADGQAGRTEPPAGRTETPAGRAESPAAASAPVSPSFDIVRVEPSGESVVAGRAAPGATIEMLRGGASFARTLADPSGLFAFVPPALPPGTSDIALRATNPDGSRVESRQNVVVEIGQKRDTAPLVTLMSPDRPTVVLSTPEPPAPARAEASSSAPDKAPAPARAPVRIVSVDAEEGGKLYVSGQAAPGASVRLYLNDTLIAPGSAGANGQVSFAIGRGVRPGKYKVRLDDVDPVTGDVKTRAEIAFGIPEPVAIASANEAGSKTVGTGHQGSGGAPVTSPFGAPPAPPAPRAPAARAEAPGPVAAASPPAGANPARSDPPVAPAVSPPSGVAGAFRVPSTAAPTGNAAPDGASGGSGSQAPAPPASSAVVEPGTRSAGSGPSRSGTSGAAAPSPSPAPDSGSAAGLSGREARGPNSTPPGPSSSSSPSSRSSSSRSGEPAGGEARAREDRAREDRARASDNVARPLDSDPSLVVVPEIGTASVTRGDNLWSISRRIYGQGVRYTTIFGANKNQIRDPDLIYPGQLFVLPPDSPTQP